MHLSGQYRMYVLGDPLKGCALEGLGRVRIVFGEAALFGSRRCFTLPIFWLLCSGISLAHAPDTSSQGHGASPPSLSLFVSLSGVYLASDVATAVDSSCWAWVALNNERPLESFPKVGPLKTKPGPPMRPELSGLASIPAHGVNFCQMPMPSRVLVAGC